MSSSAAHGRVGRPALVVLQLVVFVTYLFGPTAALGQDPSPESTATESPATEPSTEPEPSAEPEPTQSTALEPSTEPDASADAPPSAPSGMATPSASPVLWTGKDDYVPTEWVDIYGSAWNAGETVELFVDDHKDRTWSHSATATADDVGDLVYEFQLPSWFVATYTVTATGSSGRVVTTTFADSVVQGSTTTNSNSGNGTASQRLTLNLPAITPGEVAIAQVVVHKDFQSRLICPPNGWTSILKTFRGSGLAAAVYVQESFIRTTAAPAQSQEWLFRSGNCATGTLQNGFGASGGAIVYSGVDTSSPVRSAIGANGASGGTKNAPGTGAAATGDMVVRFIGNEKDESVGPATLPPRVYNVGSSNQHTRAAAAFAATHASGPTAGTFTFTSTGEWTAQTIVLRMAATGPTKLAFVTLPQAGAVNQCLGPITAQTQDATSAATNPTAATVVDLASDGSGTFFTNASCATALAASGRTIGTASNSFSFYYKATGRGDGSHLLTASATGLTSATQTQTINKASQIVTFTSTAPSGAVFDDLYTPTATGGGSGEGVTFGASGACSYSSGTVTMTSTGTCTVTADQAGNADYLAAAQASQTFSVGPKPVTVTPDGGQSKVFGQLNPPLTYTLSQSVAVAGALSRAVGEDVGLYEINIGTLASASTNHTLVLSSTPVDFAVTAKPVTVTPDAGQTKVYGEDDPALTYTLSEAIAVSGALARAAGDDVGLYEITLGTLTSDSTNHTLFLDTTAVDFEITPRPITVTANAGQSKVYGDLDGTLGYSLTSGELVGDDVFIGTLDRVAGENVGLYAIIQGDLDVADGNNGANYALTFVSDDFEITARPITVTADAGQAKVYGQPDPAAFDYTVTDGPLQGDDVFSGALDRVAGADVGPYAIGLGTLAIDDGNSGANYVLTFVANDFEITAKGITGNFFTANKVYDDSTDAAVLARMLDGVEFGDDVELVGGTAAFADHNVGTWTVTLSGATLDGDDAGNYTLLSVDTETADITARPITVTADAGQAKVYGQPDPAAFDYTVTDGPLQGDDVFSGALDRVAGADVGPYAIGLGTLAIDDGNSGANYVLTFVANDFEITPRPITVTANAGQSKVYGDLDGTLGYSLTSGELVGDDVFSGTLDRVAGENVGLYAIIQGDLDVADGNNGANYALTFVSDDFEITARPITVTADAGQAKVYGQPDPAAFDYTVTDGPLQGDDVFSGALDRVAGADVGPYAIGLGTLAIDDGNSGANYVLTFVANDFEITAKGITGNFFTANKVYDDSTDAAVLARMLDGVEFGDDVELVGGTAAFADHNVGTWTVTLSGATLDGDDAGNYTLLSVDTETADITARPITVTALSDSKTYDATTDSDETPTVSGLQGDDTATDLDQAFQSRHVMGTNGSTLVVTDYTINDGNGGDNYLVTTETAPGTIDPAALSVNAVTDTKTYDGTTTSDETPAVVGLLGTDTVTGRAQAFVFEHVMGTDGSTLAVTDYTVNDGNGGANYTVTTNDATGTINKKSVTGSFTAANKFWDGTPAATVTSTSVHGTVGLDVVNLTGGTATFASSAIGTHIVKLTGATLTGEDAGNYTLLSVGTTTAKILAAYWAEGFFRPVDMTPTTTTLKVWNIVKGGQTVPLKFRVYSAETGGEITSTAGLTVRITKIQCESGVLEADDIAPATGSTSLRYDTTDGQFIFNWAVPKAAKICYEAYVVTADGATQMAGPGGTPLHEAFFRSK